MKSTRRDSLSTRFGASLSFKESEEPCCVNAADQSGSGTISSFGIAPPTTPHSLRSLLTLELISSESAPPFTATLTSCKKKKIHVKVSFVGVPEIPCEAATTSSASSPATARSSPLRKRRKFQRRNSQTPKMLLASVTEFQSQVYQRDSNSQFDESMVLTEDLCAVMLQMDHNKAAAAAVVPTASPGSFRRIVPGCAPGSGSRRGV